MSCRSSSTFPFPVNEEQAPVLSAGHKVTDASGLTAAAREQAAGTTVKITFQRGGQDQTADITLGAATAG